MVSADIVRILDGLIVMIYQHKDVPYGVRGLANRDEGKTCEPER